MAESSVEQCRTCLVKETEMISLMADHVVCDKVMSVMELVKTCSSVQIEFEDGYPQFVCVDCIHSAEKSYEFRLQCEKADTSLRSQFAELIRDKNCELSETDNLNDLESDSYEVTEYQSETGELYLDLLHNKDNIKCEEIDIGDTGFSCTVCNLIFPTGAALAKHTNVAHGPKFYQCPRCPVRFITTVLLEKHLANHDDVIEVSKFRKKRRVDYICAVCGRKYATLGSLNIHIRKHSDRSKTKNGPIFVCQDCDQHFESSSDLQMHFEALHNLKSEEVRFKCKTCLKSFETDENLQEHIETDHVRRKKLIQQNKVSYKCRVCGDNAKSLPDIKDHLSTHHILSKDIFSNLSYQCSECNTDFSTIYEYFAHCNKVHTGANVEISSTSETKINRKRPYACSVANCEKAFACPSALKKHSETHQTHWPKKCRYCDCQVAKWHDYMIHLNKNHDDKKTFICSQCGKKFFRERNLQSHMKTHTGERNYMCDFCGFSFQAQNNLVAHRRIHTGVKPYKCTFCPQAFTQHAGLRSHLLNHTGEKKHECPTCLKKFLRIGALRNHIKTHTGVKDYACHICGALFGASSTRKKHLLTHTGERNHVCDFCGKAFSRRSNLSVHQKIHTGETPHVCDICGKGFIQAHVLRSHLNTHRKRGESKPTLRSDNKEKTTEKNNSKEDESVDEDVQVLVELNE